MGSCQLEESGSLKVRAFFGLPVPDPQREELRRYITACTALAPEFRWTPAANLHLTVRFVGGVERSLVEGIANRLVETPSQRFQVELGEAGTFRRGRLVRVVWIGLRAGADEARALAAAVEAECVRTGLVPEARPFQPHLTLARARGRDGSPLPPLPDPPRLEAWLADELVLYSSHLGRSGAVYESLRRLRLS